METTSRVEDTDNTTRPPIRLYRSKDRRATPNERVFHLVAAQNDRDVLADPGEVAVPVGDVLVRDTARHVEHDDRALSLDAAHRSPKHTENKTEKKRSGGERAKREGA